ncbi:FMN-binding negative transcriptional regulator [Undibacterium sp. SXout20W]|uniref:FMN-binding negative transcriptional regulator n=1 Tax=Undibacterium sp. SXout20W TaxID=3413051 RepID=UPI003BEFF08E
MTTCVPHTEDLASEKQVPTWNYRVLHVHGRVKFHDDDKFEIGEAMLNHVLDKPESYSSNLFINGFETRQFDRHWRLEFNR